MKIDRPAGDLPLMLTSPPPPPHPVQSLRDTKINLGSENASITFCRGILKHGKP